MGEDEVNALLNGDDDTNGWRHMFGECCFAAGRLAAAARDAARSRRRGVCFAEPGRLDLLPGRTVLYSD